MGITGSDADDPDGITFTDRHGRIITGVGSPTPPTGPPADWQPDTAAYQHPDGGRLDPRWLTLNAQPPPRADTDTG